MKKPKIAVTLGDPSGIGPEITYKALADKSIGAMADYTIVGNRKIFRFKLPENIRFIDVPCRLAGVKPGRPSKESGEASFGFIKTAVGMALEKKVDALVTAPVSKEALKLAGAGFGGHTEILQRLTGSRRVEMLMVAENLRAVLLTRHIPLNEVSRRISQKKIVAAVGTIIDYFGRSIRIIVCSLNPHAGDAGVSGSDEIRKIIPAIKYLRDKKINISGPVDASTAFMKMASDEADICIAMYHDQAMTPLKIMLPDKVVNVTLGLPFLRTSPGHGVAYDIAGKNAANPSSMIEAIKFAVKNYQLKPQIRAAKQC